MLYNVSFCHSDEAGRPVPNNLEASFVRMTKNTLIAQFSCGVGFSKPTFRVSNRVGFEKPTPHHKPAPHQPNYYFVFS
jgi:hypothetical protein